MAENILENIYNAALKFLVPLKPENTFAIIVQEAMKLVGANHGSIFLGETSKTIERVYATDPGFYEFIPREHSYTSKVYATRKPYMLDYSKIKPAHAGLTRLKIKSDILTPLSYENKTIGLLTIMSTEKRPFSEKQVRILRLFAPLATLAIRKTQLYDQTKKALETRDLFISMASHQLKTPLTSINLYAQLLQNRISQGKVPEKKWIDTLSWEILRLTTLVNELLGVDQIKTGQLQYNWKTCSLSEIVHRAIGDFSYTYPSHPVVLKDRIGKKTDVITGDYDKLLQVIFNILTNAAKFSPPHEKVFVSLNAKNTHVELSVKDKGKGIPEEDLPNIFDRFYKGRDHRKEGMGLGLYLTKKIVDEHHGKIQVHSTPGKGTSVRIILPATREKHTIPH